MLRKLWNRYTGIQEAWGIEILLQREVQVCNLCRLKINKEHISIVTSKSTINLDEVLKTIKDAKLPLTINFSGEGILTKSISSSASNEEVNNLFPGLEESNFYKQVFESDSFLFVSLINKKQVDNLCLNFASNVILQISLGGFGLAFIKPQTDQYGEVLKAGNHVLKFNEQAELLKYEYVALQNNETIRFGTLKIPSSLLNAFAQTFQLFFYPQVLPVGVLPNHQKSRLSNFIRQQQIKVLGLIILVVTFFVLLLNFLIWDHLNNEKLELESNLSFTQDMESDRDSLNSQIKRKEALLLKTGILPQSHQSIYYQIGKIVPKGIQLTAIKINQGERDSLSTSTIQIQGLTNDLLAFTQFKKELKKVKGLGEIEKESLSNDLKSGKTRFDLTVK